MANQKREWRDWEWWEHIEDLNSDIQPVATYGVQKPSDEFRKKFPNRKHFSSPVPLAEWNLTPLPKSINQSES